MMSVKALDEDVRPVVDERELLQFEAENVRTFYSLTAPARKEYTIQMAEAEAERIRIVRKAQADGILAIRKAEAEGYKLMGEALAQCGQAEQVLKLAGLVALQDVARSLANGTATKILLPHGMGDIFSLVAGWKEILASATPTASSD